MPPFGSLLVVAKRGRHDTLSAYYVALSFAPNTAARANNTIMMYAFGLQGYHATALYAFTGNVPASFATCKKDNEIGNVLGRSEPSQRDLSLNRL
jgi:hypothetical protein